MTWSYDMVRLMKIAAFAGCALALSAFPVFAQDLALPGLGGLDLDPLHIFTPAPPPPAAAPAPVAVVEHHHHHWVHHHWNHVHHLKPKH